MADPTPVTRAVTYERDLHRCCSCGAIIGLQYQHRQAVGQGGSKIRPTLVQGLTTCGYCNPKYEAEWQSQALHFGWKVRGWVGDCSRVPAFYVPDQQWFRLTAQGTRVPVTAETALAMMHEVYGPEYDEWEAAA